MIKKRSRVRMAKKSKTAGGAMAIEKPAASSGGGKGGKGKGGREIPLPPKPAKSVSAADLNKGHVAKRNAQAEGRARAGRTAKLDQVGQSGANGQHGGDACAWREWARWTSSLGVP